MSDSVSCSWCHTMNDIMPFARNYCPNCGHAADRCRMECDCTTCQRQRSNALETVLKRRREMAARAAAVPPGRPAILTGKKHHPAPWAFGKHFATFYCPSAVTEIITGASGVSTGLWVDADAPPGSASAASIAITRAAPEIAAALSLLCSVVATHEASRANALPIVSFPNLIDALQDAVRLLASVGVVPEVIPYTILKG